MFNLGKQERSAAATTSAAYVTIVLVQEVAISPRTSLNSSAVRGSDSAKSSQEMRKVRVCPPINTVVDSLIGCLRASDALFYVARDT